MESIHYIGLDVHKKTITYCIKTITGETVREGTIRSDRQSLGQWQTELPGCPRNLPGIWEFAKNVQKWVRGVRVNDGDYIQKQIQF